MDLDNMNVDKVNFNNTSNDLKNLKISVIVCTYDDPIDFLCQCMNSLLPQERICEIVIVDSSKKDDIKKLCDSLNNIKIKYIYTVPKGLSDARNKGVRSSIKDIVAFTDADCIVDDNWAENIGNSFSKDTAIVGGKILPKWLSKPNKILLNSAIAQGFYSSFDMGDKMEEVDQIFGGNFAINKNLTGQLFETELGRKKENLLSGEETELCQRIKSKGLKIIYNPLVLVWHQIPKERTKFKWMLKRIYYGGISRALVGGMPNPKVVKYLNYNIYDMIFLTIFSIPYLYGIFKGELVKNKNYYNISK
jgi:glycosyltransferase involved in cell wall biosynthesis